VLSDLSGRGPVFWFKEVPEAKAAKSRVHVDLNVSALGDEVKRLAGLDAVKVQEHSSVSRAGRCE